MEKIECPGAVVSGLIELITVGLTHEKIDEAAAVLAAVRVLRPELKALDTFDAWISIKRGNYLEGARLLRELEADAGSKPLCKALYACCLFAVGDQSWHGIAEGLIEEDADADAVGLVKALSGRYTPTPEPVEAQIESPVQMDVPNAQYLRA
ncbi:HrpB1 family type III secretion system apparatus protein [Xanthomonas nasturtii]|uniref:HrpB1 family type III secretion system apparatus protein n=1 Tax=Xanthomonas nasturtii TaxID=1843581 RepID=UPI0020122A98|nr:HrpB1 family type III secretion system apparatus protein [Xanthomonas nasturtii]MCL1499977.1 HrpB1 family type III secretion system apparatus protein [Xanthomonas nasturtii]MCL1503722.1 HrpB1 family type III secretion system apparatus protein [Xanthomonas nasturtii]MCL1521577.1 HrpB1 family type III secretion system apparatus protein [Xanthomonas nasturtii]MCL1527270.1 HrpB1 family type III secretion system apparatus protein [Xanthomonas nasturtii]MCL1534764.1 HrpB1 family type III secretio